MIEQIIIFVITVLSGILTMIVNCGRKERGMIDVKLSGSNIPVEEQDYLDVRRLVAENFNKWTMKQKIAIINALLDGGLENDGGIGSV